MTSPDHMSSRETDERHDDAHGTGSHVLLVGGNHADGLTPSIVERVLVGATVVVEPDATSALGRLTSDDDIDCVVASRSLPGLDGIEFLRAVREEFPDCPFVLVVSPGEDETVAAALSAGATDVVTLGAGPVEESLLAQRVMNAIDRGDRDGHGDRGGHAKPAARVKREERAWGDAFDSLVEYARDARNVEMLCAEAASLIADALEAEYATVLELATDDAFEIRSSVGWADGSDRTSTVPASIDTLGGRALARGKSVAVTDAAAGEWLEGPTVMPDREVSGGIAVPVHCRGEPWGVVETYSTDDRPLSTEDTAFIRAVAAILSAALDGEGVSGERLSSERSNGERADGERPDGERFDSTRSRALECAPIGYVELDSAWRLRYVNDRATTLLCRDETGCHGEEDLGGESLSEVFPTAVASRIHRECRTAFRTGEPFTFEAYYPPTDAWFEMFASPSDSGLSMFFRDVTECREQTRRLELAEFAVNTIEDGFYVLNEKLQFAMVNDEFAAMTGYSREDLLGTHLSHVVSEQALVATGALYRDVLSGEQSIVGTELELERANDDRLPVEAQIGEAFPSRDASGWTVGVVSGISEHARYERMLASLRDTTHELLSVETDIDVCERIERTAADLVGDGRATIYRFDGKETVLRPATESRSSTELSGEKRAVGPADESPVWQAFIEDELVVRDRTSPGGDESNDVAGPAPRWRLLAIPLSGYGVLAIEAARGARGTDSLDERARQLTMLLAEMTETALDRVTLASDLREREDELAERTERVTRLDRIIETLLGVADVQARSDTKEDLQRSVCEELVGAEQVQFAWIGSIDADREQLVPQAWAGSERGYTDTSLFALDADNTEPAVQASRTREPVVVSNVARGVGDERWRQELLNRGYQSVLSVPLTHDEVLYGVVTVCTSEPAAFDDLSELVFDGVATETAYGFTALENERALHADGTFSTDIEAHLTDRQFEVLRTAYLNGYFEWPRTNTGEEIAERLDITQPTFNNHLRVAERKLLTMLFEEEEKEI